MLKLNVCSRCPIPCFNLTWGRQDVVDCSKSEPPLPSPIMTGAEMFAYFIAAFGFNKLQVSETNYLTFYLTYKISNALIGLLFLSLHFSFAFSIHPIQKTVMYYLPHL